MQIESVVVEFGEQLDSPEEETHCIHLYICLSFIITIYSLRLTG